MAVREAEPVGSLQEVKEAGLDREDLLGIYRHLLITRGIEERGHILYKQGKIPGSFYTGRGNEAAAVGVATAMGPDDVGTPFWYRVPPLMLVLCLGAVAFVGVKVAERLRGESG